MPKRMWLPELEDKRQGRACLHSAPAHILPLPHSSHADCGKNTHVIATRAAQILLCIDEDLEAGDCTYDCHGAWSSLLDNPESKLPAEHCTESLSA